MCFVLKDTIYKGAEYSTKTVYDPRFNLDDFILLPEKLQFICI